MKKRYRRTTVVLASVSLVLEVFGAAFLIVFTRQISTITFGNREHASRTSHCFPSLCF